MKAKTRYPNLFSPIQIGGQVFRNRIFSAPNNHAMQGRENHPTEAAIVYYANKAKGGAACVNCGTCKVDPYGMEPYAAINPAWNQYSIHDKVNLRYFTQQADAVHHFGAKAALELILSHDLNYKRGDIATRPVPFYTASRTVKPDGYVLEDMPVEEMERLANCFADAAENAMIAKFDLILIHGGHGMLLEQFISPKYNKRTDEFGGSMANRAKFPLMCLDAVRKRVGRELLIEYRVSGNEYSSGGLTVDETIEFIRLIEDRIDLVHISGGDVGDEHTRAIMHPSGFIEETPFRKWQRAVKQAGIKVPVVAVGGVHNVDTMEDIIASGDADLVTTVRGLIADPELPKKAKEGRPEDIRPCVRCFNCLDHHKDNRFFSCTVNPEIGREHHAPYWGNGRTEKPQKVVVIGGGPGGMVAALTAAQNGQKVVLFERRKSLGGQLQFSRSVKFKHCLYNYMDYLIHQVGKAGVDVRLGEEATPAVVEAEQPDYVIAAVGAQSIVPNIPGVNGRNVVPAAEVYTQVDQLGGRVVVIGGGQVGCETALHLAQQGRQVTILEMQSKLAADALHTYRIPLIENLEENTTILVNARCESIGEAGVTYVDAAGNSRQLEADSVVLAVGMKGSLIEARAFEMSAANFRMIGDCVRARNVKWAVREAYDAAMEIGNGF